MDTVASHGPCYSTFSLGQPFPATTTTIHKKHAFGKKRFPLRRRLLLHHTVRIHSQAGFGRGTVKIKEEEEEVETTESESSSGTRKFFQLPGTVKLQNKSQSQSKSNKVVFVAGATGKVGSRTVRELLKLGFSVRASTRNVEKAQALFEDATTQSSSNGAVDSDDASPFGIFSPAAKLFGFLKPKSGKRLEIVECNLEDPDSIEPALGNAGVVVCCIGASEKEVLDYTGPYRIDFKATENLINAASSAEVSHFVLLTSLGTQKFGFPAAVLNLFWGVLLWKAKAEKALIQSGLPYTIVRPGGMERPTDAYKETHNLILGEADKLFGGQVSNLQVAELLASIVENPDVSVNKIVEAVAETTAPLRPIKELLEELPAKEISTTEPQSIKKGKPAKDNVDAPKASKKQEEEKIAANSRAVAFKEREDKLAQAQKENEEKRIQAEKDEKEKLRLQALREKYEEEIEAAREKEEAANNAAAAALAEKAELEKRVAEIRAKAEAAALAASQAKAVEQAVLAAARKRSVLSDEEREKIMESVRLARLPKEAAPAEQAKPSLKKKPAFSFLGRAAPSSTATETAVETKPVKEAEKEEVKVDAESKSKGKAVKEATADKKQEEKLKKEQETKKLAEAKKKEEQERFEKEAKERAEKEATEAKQKEEAEAKKKEEELAEAKRKEEELAEAQKKEEKLAEAKKKEEEEKAKKEAEMLKAEEEEKANELAEEEVAKQAATLAAAEKEAEEEPEEAEAPALRRKGFRWFWQPAESETPDVEESAEEVVPDVPIKAEVADQLPPCPTPLSPYARYPGLKPPARPIASPPAPKEEKAASAKPDLVASEIKAVEQTTTKVELPSQKEEAVVTEEPSKDSQDDTEARTRQIEETAAREREALEKAQATISFNWPWQKPETPEEESSLGVKEEEPAVSQESASSIIEQAPASPSIQSQAKVDTLPSSSRPLSPYAQYPGLKPPSPPKASIASQNGSATKSKLVETLASSSNPLSPYSGFPDLKPPTTPAPLAENGAAPAAEEKEDETIPEPAASSGFKWPWQQ